MVGRGTSVGWDLLHGSSFVWGDRRVVDSTILGGSHFRVGHLPPGSHSNLNQGGGKGDHLLASSLWLQGAVRTFNGPREDTVD